MKQQWLDDVKIALIEEQFDTLIVLCENLPEFHDVHDMEEASLLLHEAITRLRVEQKLCFASMEKIRKNSAFLTQEKVHARLCAHA